MSMSLYRRCMTLLVCSGCFFGGSSLAAALPFSPGEEIRYEVRWQMYRAGEAVVRVLPFSEIKGRKSWHFEMSLRTNAFLDKFFKVRDHIQGFMAEDFSQALYHSYSGTGKKKKEIRITFFDQPPRASYANFDEVRDPIEIPAGSVDPMSSYFKMRTLNMVPGQTLSFPVTDGKKAFMQMGEVLEKERIVLKSGTWETLVVTPYVTHFSGIFSKSKDPTVRVWITDDSRKIPVRIQIKVVIGRVYFDLVSYKGGRPAAAETAAGRQDVTAP